MQISSHWCHNKWHVADMSFDKSMHRQAIALAARPPRVCQTVWIWQIQLIWFWRDCGTCLVFLVFSGPIAVCCQIVHGGREEQKAFAQWLVDELDFSAMGSFFWTFDCQDFETTVDLGHLGPLCSSTIGYDMLWLGNTIRLWLAYDLCFLSFSFLPVRLMEPGENQCCGALVQLRMVLDFSQVTSGDVL